MKVLVKVMMAWLRVKGVMRSQDGICFADFFVFRSNGVIAKKNRRDILCLMEKDLMRYQHF